MKKFGIGIIGAGRIASSSHLPALSQLENVELVAVTDAKAELARKVAEEFGAKKYYSDLKETLEDPEIDGVILCLPHNLHCQATVEATRHGKHVLVEKPMALTVKEADTMIEAARENGVTLMVAHVYRFTHSYIKAKEMIEAGRIGQPLHAVCERYVYVNEPPTGWWRSLKTCGGLVIPLNGSHHIDIALWLLDADARTVYAQVLRNNPNWEGEDEATIQVRLTNEALATILLSFNSHLALNETLIIGSKGTMVIDESKVKISDKVQNIGNPKYDRFALQTKEFAEAAMKGRIPSVSAEDGRRVVRVMEAALHSAASNSVVNLGSP